ncbi:hypothetical protein L3Y21_gp097 [Gordonia phage Rabbitrun]|uniref:DUF1737 domain-containing protein n=1 Tax=Gordonia phage Rabbitrun TaxID=2762280 RepID=A0A7G8LIR4_9CAUD|nr:hypothetical protein L3Y21_gp097 [Gordonia phage Rabbitrun]QNJ57136.1 hypothetical protein SEA_RABBITRUN_97 [Gordonia phage Rabbitrun]
MSLAIHRGFLVTYSDGSQAFALNAERVHDRLHAGWELTEMVFDIADPPLPLLM